MKNLSLIPFLVLLSVTALAAPPKDKSLSAIPCFASALDRQAERLQSIPQGVKTPTCQARYDRIFADGDLSIDYFYGYMGTESDVVADRLLRVTMIEKLMSECKAGSNLAACGFEKIDEGDEATYQPIILSKDLSENRTVTIKIWDAAVYDWASQNSKKLGPISMINKAQAQKAKALTKAYMRSVGEADVLIYSGHARYGNGPGFGPWDTWQLLTSATLKPKLKILQKELARAEKVPEVMVFAACESKKYYLANLKPYVPNTAIAATSYNSTFIATQQTTFAIIDSLSKGRCEEEINQALVSAGQSEERKSTVTVDNVVRDPLKDGDMKIYGF